MKKLALTLLFFIALVMNTMAADKTSVTISVNGKSRSMIVYTPSVKTQNMPLMIITHGMNQSPEYQSVGDGPNYDGGDRLWELIDTAKFVCAYLRSDGGTWDIGGDNDVNFVSQTIDEMYTRYAIDLNRVYWSGFSMGSMLIYNGIKKIAHKIAAFAPTSGVKFDLNPAAELKSKGIKVNLIHHHSNQDVVFPIGQYKPYDYVKQIAESNGSNTLIDKSYQSQEGNYKGTKTTWRNSDGNEVVCFMYDGGGHWPSWYNRKEIWNFCKRFSKNGTPTPSVSANNPNTLNKTDFFTWSAADATGKKENAANCALELNTSTGMPYGDGNVYYLNYADLSNIDKLIVTATEGEPRFLFNRLENEGYVNVEIPRDKAEYETIIDNGNGSKTYIVDVAKIVYEYGFAHLHAIKGVNWQNTTVTSIKCQSKFSLVSTDFNPSIWEAGKYEYNESTGVGSFNAGQYGFGGWRSNEGYDVSNYSTITVNFEEAPSNGVSFRLFDVDNYWTEPIKAIDCDGKTSVSYDISNVDKLYIIGFWAYGTKDASRLSMKIKSVVLTPKPFVTNDVNADGKVDLMDVSALSSILISKAQTTRRADINSDGTINLIDITTLINKLK